MKKILLTLVGVICSLGMWADDSTFGITRTVASSTSTSSDSKVSSAYAVSEDQIVGSTSDVTVSQAYTVESTMTDKARKIYWYNGSNSLTCYVDKDIKNYRNSTSTLGDNNFYAFTLTIASGKAITIKSITGDVLKDADNTSYQMAIINNAGEEVYTSQTKAISKASDDAKKTVKVSDLSTVVQTALTNMTGTVTVKLRWTNTANTGKYCVIKDFNVVATVGDAPAQTQYTKPTITQGAYDQPTGMYAVTLKVNNDEDGTINYTIGSNDKVTGVASGTVVNVAPNTTIKATVSGSTYTESDEASLTTANKPQLDAPTATLGAYNFETGKYAITLSAATGAKIYYTTDNWETYPEYTAAIEVAAGKTLKAKAKQNNMTDSEDLVYTVPAAPADGNHTTPSDGSESYTSGTAYNAGAYTIPADPTYLGGTISSGNSSINGAIKMRLGRKADPNDFADKLGFHLDVNSGYTITSVKLQILNNYNTDISATGIYVDDATTTNLLASPITLPYASASSVAAAEVKAENIGATKRIVFTFDKNSGEDGPNQAQVLITVTYLVPVYNAGVTSEGYGTMYYEKELVVPANTVAYKGILSGSTLKLSPIAEADEVIPANTPVVIKGDGGLFKVGTTAATAISSDLKGTAVELATPAYAYVLGYTDSEKTCFYKYTGATIAANKAYLVVSSGAKGIKIAFDDETTAINAVSTVNAENNVRYNLAGQRVNATAKGIVIMNGKKYIK